MKVLIVEDEPKLAGFVKKGLEEQAWEVDVAYDGQVGSSLALSNHYDVIVLDVNLPKINGFELAALLRREDVRTPILMLTALGTLNDKLAGFDAGADDYLVKPFNLEELLLRVANLIKRQKIANEVQFYTFGENSIDFKTYEVNAKGVKITLSKREHELLKLLILKANEVISRDEILDVVWGKDKFPTSRTIDNYILNFRKYF